MDGSAGRLCLSVPPEEEVLSLEEAVASLADCERSEVERVYDYWIGKRSEFKKPLLSEMWNFFPWSVRTFQRLLPCDHPPRVMCSFVQVILDRSIQSRTTNACQRRGDDNSELPFEGSLAPLHVPSVKIPLDEQLHRLQIIRQDLEASLTMRCISGMCRPMGLGGKNVGRSGSTARETQKETQRAATGRS